MRYLILRMFVMIPATISKMMAKPMVSLVLAILGVGALHDMYEEIMPFWWCWAVPMLILIYLDTSSGIKAARYRIRNGSPEKVTTSTLLKGLFNKTVSYGGWVFFALSVGYLTGNGSVGVWGILASVAIELLSIVENHLEVKGLGISWEGVWRTVKAVVSSRTGVDMGDGSLITRKGGRGCGEIPEDNDNGTITK